MSRPPLPLGTWGKIARTRLAPDRWRARARYRDYDGKTRLVERYGPTGAAAERALLEQLRDRQAPAGHGEITNDTSLSAAAEWWEIKRLPNSGKASSTIKQYTRTIHATIIPGVGDLRLRELTPARVDRFLDAQPSDSARRFGRTVLGHILNECVRIGVLQRNPVRDAPPITRKRRAKPVSPTDGQVLAYRAAVARWCGGNTFGPRRGDGLPELIDVIIGSGLRIGEALALRIEDVDLDAGTVLVAGTITGTRRQDHPKTTHGYRLIRVSTIAVDALRRRCTHELAVVTGIVWPSGSGTYRSVQNVERQLREARPESLGWMTPHSLRKWVATRVAAGLGSDAAAAQLGHSGTAVTEAHYIARPTIGPDIDHLVQLSPEISDE